MTRRILSMTAALAVFALWMGPAASVARCDGEGLVTFQDLRTPEEKSADPEDSTSGSAMMALYRKHYKKPNAVPSDLDVDSFLTYQAAVSEFLMKPELHKNAETNFNKRIRDGLSDPDLYYVSTWAASSTTMYDGSGDIHATRRHMTEPGMKMEGKQMYFPSEEALQKIIAIEKETKDAASLISNADPKTLDDFFQKKDDLEKKLLQVIADELVKMRDEAAGADVYGLGYVKAGEEYQPVKLNMDVLKNFMTERGVELPDSKGKGPAAAAAPPARDLSVQPLAVKQSAATQAELNTAYDSLMQPLSEKERTEREVKYDMFRFRGRPSDPGTGQPIKTYDPLMTFEYQTGGLSLPSRQQE